MSLAGSRRRASAETKSTVEGSTHRRIDPVDVFEDQQQRVFRGQRFERLADLPHHPLARRSENFPLQRRSLFWLEQ